MEKKEQFQKLTVAQLKEHLAERGESTEGLKPNLVERAVAAAARESSRTSEQTPAEVSNPDTSDATDPRSSNGTSPPPAPSDGSTETHGAVTSNTVKQELYIMKHTIEHHVSTRSQP